MAQKITHWLLIALILSLGFGQLLRFEYFGAAIYVHDILIVAILALNSSSLVDRNFWRAPGVGLIGLGLATGWAYALVQYPFSSLLIPALYLARLMVYLLLYLMLKYSNTIIARPYFIISGLTTLVIGLIQYTLLPDMRVFQYLGWDDHLNRLTLPHFDPTYTGVMLGLFMLAFFRTYSIFNILVLLFSILALLLTYSRSVWLSLTITSVALIRPKKYLLFLMPIVLVAIYLLPQRFGEGTNLARTYSITSRLEHDYSILRQIEWGLIPGVGFNTLAGDKIANEQLPSNHAGSPNNSFVHILATSGIIGLMGWLIFLGNLYQTSSHKATLIFVLIASLFNNVLFYPFAMLWLFLLQNMEDKT